MAVSPELSFTLFHPRPCDAMRCGAIQCLLRVDATNWGETQKIIEAIHKMPLDGVTSRRDADEVIR